MKILIKKIRNFFRILKISLSDFIENVKYCGFYKDTDAKIKWRILLLAHSLEKGLSVPNKKINFGEQKAIDLCNYLNKYEIKDDYIFREGYSVLEAYKKYRESNNLDNLKFMINHDCSLLDAGIIEINKDSLKYDTKDFVKLCDIRHSVREFSNKYVTEKDINKAIDIARKSPSACNRQMIKIYSTENIEKNQELSILVPGNKGFENEKTRYLFLTADRNSFDYFEIYQWYLNGGIFVAFLQLALTSLNIGSCIYQWPRNKKIDEKVKSILEIPKNEIIVSVLGVGYYKETFKVLKSTKKNTGDLFINRK